METYIILLGAYSIVLLVAYIAMKVMIKKK